MGASSLYGDSGDAAGQSGAAGGSSAGGAGGGASGATAAGAGSGQSGSSVASGTAGSSSTGGTGASSAGGTGASSAGGTEASSAGGTGASSAGGTAGAAGSAASRAGPGGTTGRAGDGADGMGASSLYGDEEGAGSDGRAGGSRTGGSTASGPNAGAGVSGSSTAGTSGAAGSGADDATAVGMVEAPGGSVRIEEEVTPQTLGGMLPMTVGVDEEGQFDFDQAVLRAEVKAVLDELTGRLRDAEWDRLDIIGYTDRIGTDDYNQHLSEQRAWAVARYLVDQGIPLNKLKVQGRGERDTVLQAGECKDLARDDLIACLQRDRRVEIEASIRRSHANLQ
jgi:outer membrane protein OmpA-like peptidoglycan-associated protein